VDLTSFAGLQQITHIITDSDVAPSFVEALRRICSRVTVCGEESISNLD
jgi:hypothetical protein